jgi:hypothetical protein
VSCITAKLIVAWQSWVKPGCYRNAELATASPQRTFLATLMLRLSTSGIKNEISDQLLWLRIILQTIY